MATRPGAVAGLPLTADQQPALDVEVQRLVRREHRQRRQRVRLDRMRRVGHVEHGDAERRARRPYRVEREQQRRVIERALVALLV